MQFYSNFLILLCSFSAWRTNFTIYICSLFTIY